MNNFEVVTIGSSLRDLYFITNEGSVVNNPSLDPIRLKLLGFELGAKVRSSDVLFSFGGGAGNTAVNLAGLGIKVGIESCVGKDIDGEALRDYYQKKGIGVEGLIETTADRTGLSFLVIDKRTKEHVAFVFYGTNERLKVTRTTLEKVPSQWLYVASLNMKSWEQSMRAIVTAKRQLFWNPGAAQISAGLSRLRPYLSRTDVLLLNRDEATELVLTDPACRVDRAMCEHLVEGPRLLARSLKPWVRGWVVVTDGAKGAYAFDGTTFLHDKPHHGPPVDTTGAGDCFGSTLLAGLVKTGDMRRAMRASIVNTSSLVMHLGAQHGLLTWSQIRKKI